MQEPARLKAIVADLLQIDPESIQSSFSLRHARLQNSAGRGVLAAAIHRQFGVYSARVFTATRFGELEEAIFGSSGSAVSSGPSAANEPEVTAAVPVPALGIAIPGVRIGVDIEMVESMPDATDFWTDAFYQAHFTPAEIAYCVRQEQPRIHFAARWCAKEALAKCDSTYLGVDPRRVQILPRSDGRPAIELVDGTGGSCNRFRRQSVAHTRHGHSRGRGRGHARSVRCLVGWFAVSRLPVSHCPGMEAVRMHAAKEWLLRIGMVVVSVLVSLLIAEGIVRLFFPIYDGRNNVTLSGETIKDWFEPGSVYRQVSNEYNAVTTITAQGHRVPGASGSPEVVFIGDSFTYGYGLSDDETFAAIYCAEQRRPCANLGIPSSGTARQVQRLEKFINDWQWQPKEVKFFFFGMSGSLSAGNDFVDNYNYGRWLKAQAAGTPAPRPERRSGLAGRIIGAQSAILERSHLMRRAKFNFGPVLKAMILDDPGEERMAESLVYTLQALKDLDDLSRRAGFDYSIFLIVPVQDVILGTYGKTLAALNSVSPRPVTSTAPLFVDSPQQYLYSYRRAPEPQGEPPHRGVSRLARSRQVQLTQSGVEEAGSMRRTLRFVLVFVVLIVASAFFLADDSTPRPIRFPDGKRFAFSIIDDTDMTTLERVKPVYDVLQKYRVRTTKTVWVKESNNEAHSTNKGDSLRNPSYRQFVLDLQSKGFEIALHGVRGGSSRREEISEGLEEFRQVVGRYPRMHINHSQNRDNIYWGKHVLSIAPYRWVGGLAMPSDFHGHEPGSPVLLGRPGEAARQLRRGGLLSRHQPSRSEPFLPVPAHRQTLRQLLVPDRQWR